MQAYLNGKLWETAFTAAIIGIIPRYRYVLFTRRMLQEMPPNRSRQFYAMKSAIAIDAIF